MLGLSQQWYNNRRTCLSEDQDFEPYGLTIVFPQYFHNSSMFCDLIDFGLLRNGVTVVHKAIYRGLILQVVLMKVI